MLNRRGFLAALAGGAAAAADPERLLWTPGAKLISIPRPLPISHYAVFFPTKPGRYKPGDNVRMAGHTYTVVEKLITAPGSEVLRMTSALTAADHAIIARYWQMAVRVG